MNFAIIIIIIFFFTKASATYLEILFFRRFSAYLHSHLYITGIPVFD